jgi:hypothetical protein
LTKSLHVHQKLGARNWGILKCEEGCNVRMVTPCVHSLHQLAGQ